MAESERFKMMFFDVEGLILLLKSNEVECSIGTLEFILKKKLHEGKSFLSYNFFLCALYRA